MVLRPTQEFFTYMETSPLPVKGCKIQAQWLERRAQRSDELGVRTPLWDVGTGLSDDTVYVAVGVD